MSALSTALELAGEAVRIGLEAYQASAESEAAAEAELRTALAALRLVDVAKAAHAPADGKLEVLKAAQDTSAREVADDVYPDPSEDV